MLKQWEWKQFSWLTQLIRLSIHFTITFFNRFSQGFWAREKAVARSCDSLNPQNIFRGNVSFCHEWTRSPSSETSVWETDVWRADRRSVDEKKHCQARKRDPYSGPERDKHTQQWKSAQLQTLLFNYITLSTAAVELDGQQILVACKKATLHKSHEQNKG